MTCMVEEKMYTELLLGNRDKETIWKPQHDMGCDNIQESKIIR